MYTYTVYHLFLSMIHPYIPRLLSAPLLKDLLPVPWKAMETSSFEARRGRSAGFPRSMMHGKRSRHSSIMCFTLTATSTHASRAFSKRFSWPHHHLSSS